MNQSIAKAFRLPLLIGLLVAAACSAPKTSSIHDLLETCKSNDGPVDALCGTFEVYEDREAASGRKIPLKIVVLPALGNEPKPDPLFFLAGGPGGGAADMASGIKPAFARIQSERDIVLVDQRGTGDSNPLKCELDEDSLEELSKADEMPLDELRACLEGYDADAKLYTTSIAMDDLDDVRQFLGYGAINVYGGSYGTRAALVYLRRHEEHGTKAASSRGLFALWSSTESHRRTCACRSTCPATASAPSTCSSLIAKRMRPARNGSRILAGMWRPCSNAWMQSLRSSNWFTRGPERLPR